MRFSSQHLTILLKILQTVKNFPDRYFTIVAKTAVFRTCRPYWGRFFTDYSCMRAVREHTMDIHPQEVIRKGNVEIKVDGIIWAKPVTKKMTLRRRFTILTTGSRPQAGCYTYRVASFILFVFKDIFYFYAEGFCDSKCQGE
jgi:hypothetical protein